MLALLGLLACLNLGIAIGYWIRKKEETRQ